MKNNDTDLLKKIAVLNAKIASFNASLAGMIAANKETELRQEYPQYNEGNFNNLIDEYEFNKNELDLF